MDPDSVKSTLSNLAFGNVMAAAARDYQKELLAKGKAQASQGTNEEVDLDELLDCFCEDRDHGRSIYCEDCAHGSNTFCEDCDQVAVQLRKLAAEDPELEKLHADRIAALKKEAEKREVLKRQGHGEYREVSEGDFLGEVTGSERVICHFYHREFYRCKIMDKHLKALAPQHINTKFIKLDAENAPFFVTKLGVKTLPCVILFRKGIAFDRIVGFQDLGAKDDFTTRALENVLKRKGIIDERKADTDDDDEDGHGNCGINRSVRSSAVQDSDSD